MALLRGWRWHMAKWHFFSYDEDANEGGSVCGKYGYRVIGRGKSRGRTWQAHPTPGETVCEICARSEASRE